MIEWNPIFDDLPGGALVHEGVTDMLAGQETAASLLVQIGRPRLLGLGLRIPEGSMFPEHQLYDFLARSDQDSAHSRYNALVRILVSFMRAAECVTR
jgi:hypothetical protein